MAKLIRSGQTYRELIKATSLSRETIRAVAVEYGLTVQRTDPTIQRWGPVADPDEAEIRRRCLEIQRGWSETERLRRLAVPDRVEWQPPTYAAAELGLSDDVEC
ncbi:MAG: hypothetical protein KDJ36_18295 [Hyphomicrobiaceae bacterium]|nr:hypothetical protein [Hyphomicrobiaceae bacterium]